MSNFVSRLERMLRGKLQRRRLPSDEEMADSYMHMLGVDLTPDAQRERFKRTTQGAPVVHRHARPVVTR